MAGSPGGTGLTPTTTSCDGVEIHRAKKGSITLMFHVIMEIYGKYGDLLETYGKYGDLWEIPSDIWLFNIANWKMAHRNK